MTNPKLIEAAMAVLQTAGSLNVTVLNKALFYLDLVALRDIGQTVTGQTYMALAAGPVIAKYDKRLVAALVDQGLATQADAGKSKPLTVNVGMTAFRNLSEPELEHARKLGRWAAGQTATKVSDLSHENLGWKTAYAAGLGSKGPKKAAMPIDLNLALQQVADADPWMDEPVAPTIVKLDATPTVPWL